MVPQDLKVAIKFVPADDYHRQLGLHKELRNEAVARMADSYAAARPGQSVAEASYSGGVGGEESELQHGWGLACLVLEYGECSLADYMGRGLLPTVELKATFEAIVRATLALHAHGLAHAALQPESFRLYDGTHWRLANVDSCTRMGEPTPAKCAVCYAAPEIVRNLRGQHVGAPLTTAVASPAVDVWSLGVLLWQLYSQQPLFGSEAEALANLPAGGLSVEASMGCVADVQARHLLEKMLRRDPLDRISAQAILKHSYLTGGLDTVEMDSTFGPMQKGQLFVRSMLQQLSRAAR